MFIILKFKLIKKYINNFIFCKTIKLFIKPFKKSFINVLRAPYKNKLSRLNDFKK